MLLSIKERLIMFKGGMGNMMKQAQQMQERMQQAQEEIKNMEVVGEAGAGLVKVTMLGSHNVRRIEIDESLMEDDKEMIEDLVAAALNDAVRRVAEASQAKMSDVTGGMPLPPGFKMPFWVGFVGPGCIRGITSRGVRLKSYDWVLLST